MNKIIIFLFLIPFDLTKEISVRILSKYNLKEIYVHSGNNKYFVKIYNKDKIKVNGFIKNEFFIVSPDEILIESKNIRRKYRGKIRIYAKNDELFIINHINLRDYLSSVIVAEIGTSYLEALKAQALLSRTFVLFSKRHEDYDFCDLTHCQVYRGIVDETAVSRKAVIETDGEVLTYNGKLIEPFYSSCCGGFTASPEEIFDLNIPYVEAKVDTYCQNSKNSKWIFKIEKRKIGKLKIIEIGESGRIKKILLNNKEISGWGFRNMISRKYGWNTLKSNLFNLYEDENFYIFEGKGLGHGIGMCQKGAKVMALKGFNYKEIINFYFKDVEIKKLRFEYKVFKDKNFVFYSISGEKYLPYLKNAFYRFERICKENGIEIDNYFVIKETIDYFNFTKNLKIKPFYGGYIEKDTIKLAPLNLLEKYSIIEDIIIHELLHAALSKYNFKKEIEEGIIYLLCPYNFNEKIFNDIKSYREEIKKIEIYKKMMQDSLEKYGNLENFLSKRR
ncbi:MAG: SpoIID/LytB domain-containing protein [candidate division WOR-3 bacterium]